MSKKVNFNIHMNNNELEHRKYQLLTPNRLDGNKEAIGYFIMSTLTTEYVVATFKIPKGYPVDQATNILIDAIYSAADNNPRTERLDVWYRNAGERFDLLDAADIANADVHITADAVGNVLLSINTTDHAQIPASALAEGDEVAVVFTRVVASGGTAAIHVRGIYLEAQ